MLLLFLIAIATIACRSKIDKTLNESESHQFSEDAEFLEISESINLSPDSLFCQVPDTSLYFFDRGIGMVSFISSSLIEEAKKYDSITIYRDHTFDEIVEIFSFNPNDRFDYFKYQNPKKIKHKQFEFQRERFGLPIIHCENKSSLIKVIYKYGEEGTPITGLIKYDKAKMNIIYWKDFLLDKPLYFPQSKLANFHSTIEGDVLSIDLPKSHKNGTYIMRPLERKKNWLKVNLIFPSDYCFTPSETEINEVWIKYLSEAYRPLVWYYVRGC